MFYVAMLSFIGWIVLTTFVFKRAKTHNKNCIHESLRISWEPWIISIGSLSVILGWVSAL